MSWLLLLPPIVILLTAWLGNVFTSKGVKSWYPTLKRPRWTPKGTTIGAVWTVIYLLAIGAGVRYFNMARDPQTAWLSALLFLLTAVLNVSWSWLFFVRHRLSDAFWDAVILECSVLTLMAVFWKVSPLSAWLLAPYAAWTVFASYLNHRIEAMNR